MGIQLPAFSQNGPTKFVKLNNDKNVFEFYLCLQVAIWSLCFFVAVILTYKTVNTPIQKSFVEKRRPVQ